LAEEVSGAHQYGRSDCTCIVRKNRAFLAVMVSRRTT
jgi:hypothetical protein